MDPNGCVLSLKGLGADLSTVKQLIHLPRGEEGSGSEPEVTGLIPDPCWKQLRRGHVDVFYADLWHVTFWSEIIRAILGDLRDDRWCNYLAK